jgi:hypothetical protein
MSQPYQRPNFERSAFAKTNVQTIQQRAAILKELLPNLTSLAEVCCGDCSRQRDIYMQAFNLQRFCGVDIAPEVAALNKKNGIECILGDALDINVLKRIQTVEAMFFGPPLSVDCDGHHLLDFRAITPAYTGFAKIVFGELNYKGLLVCICPRHTTMGDAQWLYEQIQAYRPDVGLRLMHHSHSTITGGGEVTEPRLKYVELWFSSTLENAWEVRQSEGSC